MSTSFLRESIVAANRATQGVRLRLNVLQNEQNGKICLDLHQFETRECSYHSSSAILHGFQGVSLPL